MKGISLNRNQLKYIVIVAMLIDHIAWLFVPMFSAAGQIMHFIGRLTAPTMAFFIAEGYHYTRNFKKYAFRMAIFAVISWVPFAFFECGNLPILIHDGRFILYFPRQSVIYTLFLGLMSIRLWDSKRIPMLIKIFGIGCICVIAVLGDWMFIAVLWCLSFHIFRDKPVMKWTAFCVIGLYNATSVLRFAPWWGYIFQFGIYTVPLLIGLCYNGEPGSKNAFNKWFFYIFYPAHLLIIGIAAHNT